MHAPRFCLIALVFSLLPQAASAAAAENDGCDHLAFEQAAYIVCSFDPAARDLRLFWRNAEGAPYRRFDRLANDLDRRGKTLGFAMNAGMYTPEFAPVGLYIEDGDMLHPLNTQQINAPPARIPNFFKQPNGVFYLEQARAGIVTTAAYAEGERSPRYATQSGPMLVIAGRLHPALIEGSTSLTRRSGVGVCENGEVRFAISELPVNFHEFARLFRDRLGCPDALFLDGGRGAGVYRPALDRSDLSGHGGYGPIVGLALDKSADHDEPDTP